MIGPLKRGKMISLEGDGKGPAILGRASLHWISHNPSHKHQQCETWMEELGESISLHKIKGRGRPSKAGMCGCRTSYNTTAKCWSKAPAKKLIGISNWIQMQERTWKYAAYALSNYANWPAHLERRNFKELFSTKVIRVRKTFCYVSTWCAMCKQSYNFEGSKIKKLRTYLFENLSRGFMRAIKYHIEFLGFLHLFEQRTSVLVSWG